MIVDCLGQLPRDKQLGMVVGGTSSDTLYHVVNVGVIAPRAFRV